MRALVLWLMLFNFATSAHADSQPPKYELDGVDITAFVNYFSSQVRTLNKSVTVYNWSPSASSDPFWKTNYDPKDPRLLATARDLSQVFWNNYGGTDSDYNNYGYGLYTSVDVVATRSYGGYGSSDWLLLEMQLPQGFRVLDFTSGVHGSDMAALVTTKVIGAKFNCLYVDSAERLFYHGGSSLDPACKKLVRKVFQDILKIDGFAYSYGHTPFKACGDNNNSYHAGAFVITRPDWIRSEYIKFYTQTSSFDLEGRTRIQTLLMNEDQDISKIHSRMVSEIASYLKMLPGTYIKDIKSECVDSSCWITANFCDLKDQCRQINLSSVPRPGGPLISAVGARDHHLLWSDLEGKPKSTTANPWLKENAFGCSGELPYSKNPEATKGVSP